MNELQIVKKYYDIFMKDFFEKFKDSALIKKKKEIINAIRAKGNSYSGKNEKSIISGSETVTFSVKAEKLIAEIKEEVSNINREMNENSEKLIEYIESKGTPVYRINNAQVLLEKIHEHTGFITELNGPKAMYINTLTGRGVGVNSPAMFIISENKKLDYYLLLREFYLWYSMSKGLDGFDFKTQEIFKKYINSKKSPDLNTNKLKYEDMAGLKEALKRDNEANDFVMALVRNKEGGANVLKKMQDGGAFI